MTIRFLFTIIRSQRGITLLEALIGFAVLTVISAFGFLAYFGYQRNAEVSAAARTVQDYLRQAQTNSITGQDFKNWGVLFTNPTGAGGNKMEFYSCSAACNASGACGGTSTFTEPFFLGSGAAFTTPADSATVDVCFDKRTGKVQGAAESIVITGVSGCRTVTISAEGQIMVSAAC